jgi:uncharacterized protein YcaQ
MVGRVAVRRPVAERLPTGEARRIALAAQGFAGARRSANPGRPDLRRVIDQVAVLQLDPVNVLCRAHYLPLFARLGPYPRGLLDDLAWGGPKRELFEYWAHKASLLPLRLQPLLRWRMRAAADHVWGGDLRKWRSLLDPALLLAPWAVIEGMWRLAAARPQLLDEVLAVVTERGPVQAAELGLAVERRLRQGGLWNWHDGKVALEWLFYSGTVTIARRHDFDRVYDLTERVLPATVLAEPTPTQDDAQRELTRIAARAYGIATEAQLRRYFHLPAEHSKARVAELVAAGELTPVRVEAVPQQMYLWPPAATPRAVRARALLSPFDSLIWDRDRTLQLFDFHYRISLYTPAAKRTHGYYVMPFLLGERLVARVDVRADRGQSVLRVPEANGEPGQATAEVAAELAEELRLMATWLELERVVVDGRGDLGPALSRAVEAAGPGRYAHRPTQQVRKNPPHE